MSTDRLEHCDLGRVCMTAAPSRTGIAYKLMDELQPGRVHPLCATAKSVRVSCKQASNFGQNKIDRKKDYKDQQ